MRFAAIDGLRAWLAWAVVAAHLVRFCDVVAGSTLGTAISNLGAPAVNIFIVISGFVISGLLIEKKEPWLPYITRRFFRIFPLYLFLLPLTAVLMIYGIAAYETMPWIEGPSDGLQRDFQAWREITREHPISQWIIHVGLLQGIVPDTVWPRTSDNFLTPAWSLSLEWQFYLIAPLFVYLLRNRKWAPMTVFGVMFLAVVFNRNTQLHYNLPSFLPLAAFIFMVGIASRFAFEKLQRIDLPSILVIAFVFFGFIYNEIRWLAVWATVLLFLLNESRWQGGFIFKAMSAALTSKWAVYFGERSYSTYLVHFPIMYLLLIVLSRFQFSKGAALTVFSISAILSTGFASHLLFRYIEQPFIKIGSRLARLSRPD